MNISLLISGNLTGFGRFFTSPAAKELLGTDKIDLDNHNHISFLGDNEKAYSITFAQRYIAISLYTRILDSFRRPGELVVTLLIPRNQIIVPNSGPSIGATYSLLNKVCDKFFEKNFHDGMINQNPVVLGQDYYSEILDNYRLKPMNMREVNLNPSSVKKVGYVKAQETDIPKYLDTPCRENYNDHNLIIIAQSAPAGIDEEPEEVILYSIHIKNNGATLPGRVKLASLIYKYQAQAGEKPFHIQGTYKDAVEHLLEPRITARIMPNDVVEISYNFEKEEKTVNFIFLDKNTGVPISFDVVLPSVVIDGIKVPISSKTFTFRGAEIHASKKLVSDNSNYTISKRSEFIDLSRIGNNQDLTVYVEQGFVLPMSFNKPYDVRKNIVFINKLNGQTESVEVTDRKTIHLSGSVVDWEFYITSDTYCAPQQPIRIVNGQWMISKMEKQKANVNTPQASTTISSSNHTVAVQKQDSGHDNSSISLTGGETSDHTTSHNRKLSYKKLAMIIAPLLCILGGVGYYFVLNNLNKDDDNSGGGNTPHESKAYGAFICYYDDSKIESRDTLLSDEKDLLKYSFFNSNGNEITDNIQKSDIEFESGNKKMLVHAIEFTDSIENVVKVKVSFNYKSREYIVGEGEIKISEIKKDSMPSISAIQGVNYGIRHSQLKEFLSLGDKTFNKKKEWINWKDQYLKGVSNEDLIASLEKTLKDKEPQSDVGSTGGTSQDTTVFPEQLEKNTSYLTQQQLKSWYIDKKGTSPEVKQRAQCMYNTLAKIQNLEVVTEVSQLSSSQQETISLYNKGVADNTYHRALEKLKNKDKLRSFGEVHAVVKDFTI